MPHNMLFNFHRWQKKISTVAGSAGSDKSHLWWSPADFSSLSHFKVMKKMHFAQIWLPPFELDPIGANKCSSSCRRLGSWYVKENRVEREGDGGWGMGR